MMCQLNFTEDRELRSFDETYPVSRYGLQLMERLLVMGYRLPALCIKTHLKSMTAHEGAWALAFAKQLKMRCAYEMLESTGATFFATDVLGENILYEAVLANDMQRVKFLLENVDILTYRVTLLPCSTDTGPEEVKTPVKLNFPLKMRNGVTGPNWREYSPIQHYRLTMTYKRYERRHTSGVFVVDYDYDVLYLAVRTNHPECVDEMLKAKPGMLPNAPHCNMEVLLVMCTEKGYAKCLEILLAHGLSATRTATGGMPSGFEETFNSAHCNLMTVSIQDDHDECLKVLLRNGANKNMLNELGETMLHKCASEGSPKCLQVLIEAGADLNGEDLNLNTPLHFAVEHKQLECVEMLVEAGARKDKKNLKGQTPDDISKLNGFKKNVKALLQP